MGGMQSANKDFEKAMESFNGSEQERIHELYKNICQHGKWMSTENLKAHCGKYMDFEIIEALHHYMKLLERPELQQNVSASYEGFVICLANALKGSVDDKTIMLGCLASGAFAKQSTMNEIIKVIRSFWRAYLRVLELTSTYRSWTLSYNEADEERMIQALTDDLVKTDGAVSGEEMLQSKEVIHKWLQRNALLLTLIDTVMHACFPISLALDAENPGGAQFPVCKDANWAKFKTLLDPASLVYLSFHVPQDLRNHWRLLYASSLHGESFTTMCRRMLNEGPSLLVLRDSHGHVFGCFAPESWLNSSQFRGNASCFLFRVQPDMVIYNATGFNENYLYLNHGQETLANGLGVGGTMFHYGLYLSEEFTKGHSKYTSTFSNQQLSAHEQFTVDRVEVWGLGKPPKSQSDEDEDTAGSILDKDPEAKAMLALIDKGPHSEGLREKDPLADVPEEHSLPSGLG